MPAPTTAPSAIAPFRELRHYLAQTVQHCRRARWFGALFHVTVVQDIAGDVAQQHETLARKAYAAQQDDLEAHRLLTAAAADGFSQADLPNVEKACRLILRSAEHDRAISEQLG